jgi:hypothetical protein
MKTALLLLALLPVQEGGVRERTEFIPGYESPLPVTPGRHVMVLAVRHLTLAPPATYSPHNYSLSLSSSGGGYRWCYLPKRHNTDRGPLATLDNTLELGVTRSHSLVEVEVTEPMGSPDARPALLLSSFKVLDGTKEFPLQTHKVVAEAKTLYETFAKTQETAPALEKARVEAKGDAAKTQPAKTAVLMYVTWMEATGKLQVRLLTRLETTDGVDRPGHYPGRGPPPPARKLNWGADFGMLYEADRNGKIDKTIKLPIQSWVGSSPAAGPLDWRDLAPK